MFAQQRIRLLREEKWTPDELAREIYAMMGPDVPLEHHGQITLHAPANGAPLVIKGLAVGDVIIQLPNREGAVEDDDAPVLDVVAAETDSTTENQRTGIAGEILSGTHPDYSVRIYPEGLSADTETVTVKQLSGVSGVALQAGTWVIVYVDVNGDYFMNVPVW